MELIVSDMDGTLLNDQASITFETANILNYCIDRGMHFTVATARTPFSALPILKSVKLNLPLILMNGALIYDDTKQEYLSYVSFDEPCIQTIAAAENEARLHGLIFAMEEGALHTYMGGLTPHKLRHYFDFNQFKNNRAFYAELECKSAAELTRAQVVFALYMDDSPQRLEVMRQVLSAHPGFVLDYYQDSYSENLWGLEISNAAASKGQAVNRLKNLYQASHVVGFGDNSNDLSLFAVCDERYAVRNACAQIIACADAVIAGNDENGVAAYLKHRWETK